MLVEMRCKEVCCAAASHIQLHMKHSTQMINKYVTGLYITILFIIILDCVPTTTKKFTVKEYAMLHLWQPQAFCVYHVC